VVVGRAVKGVPKGTFILTLDSSSNYFIIERGTKRNAVQLSFVPEWRSFALGAPGKIVLPISTRFYSPMYFRLWSTEHKLIRFLSKSLQKSRPAPPTIALLLSALSMGRFWARCMLGSDLKPRSITTVTDLGC
jgi:hypothetical protein